MIPLKVVTAIYLGAALFAAHAINIRGTVVNNEGTGMSGATVALENAGLSSRTDSSGNFILADTTTTGIKIKTVIGSVSNPIITQKNKIKISLSNNVQVSVNVYDISGRQLFNCRKMLNGGTHLIDPSLQSNGIYLYKIRVGRNDYLFKSAPFGFTSKGNNVFVNVRGSAGITVEVSASTTIRDIISVVADGEIDYCDSMKTSDTSGVLIKMIPNAGNVIDVNGNVYQSVQIGSQVWTVQNLRTTKYNDSTTIPLITNATEWSNLKTPGYCFYNNSTNIDTCKKWGALYNWYVVNTGKLAPRGWHIPKDEEWDTLKNYLITNGYNSDRTQIEGNVAFSLAARTDWRLLVTGNDLRKNNRSGFSALPSGMRKYTAQFESQCFYGYWWSVKESSELGAYCRDIGFGTINRDFPHKGSGLSVRLLKD